MTATFAAHVRHWERCTRCNIGKWAFKHCFGVGNKRAAFVFVGEGPGASEDALGIPFVGASGRLLQKALGLAGYHPSDWFLTNLVACHPTDAPGGGNRPPSEAEILNCAGRLQEVVRLVAPRYVVAVGSVPAAYLLGAVGRFGDPEPVYAKVRHPAWVLRQGGERSEEFCTYVDSLREIRRAYGNGTTKEV